MKIYNITTYRPEQCGIAAWAEDKINYSHKIDPSFRNRVIAVNGFRKKNEYSDFVDFCIDRNNSEDYVTAAKFINNNPQAKVVGIQHEFGIFGGKRINGKALGNYILKFIDHLKKPLVTTCHTTFAYPLKGEEELFEKRKIILKEVLSKSDKIIAISNTARNILVKNYNINPKKINVILHGIHKFDESTEHAKKILGLEDRFVLSMVGLVRKKRGMEHVIRALPPVVGKHPELLYVLAGKTHPKEIEDGKEPYRDFLKNEVSRLNLEDNVLFVNRFLPLTSLLRYIQASDACITPYADPRQISSGVLSYNLGLEKPTISTPFNYAKEILDEGRGIILPDFNNPDSISKAIFELLDNPEKIVDIKKNIKPFKEQMLWENVAKKYIEVEKSVIK
jgi:glycosyltransferase involved in cell wall biosynthesis